MATGGQYNIPSSYYNGSYPTVRPNPNGNQYGNFSVPLSQGQQVPNQTTQGRWTNERLPNQGIPDTEPFLENNHTRVHSMHSEECRSDSYEVERIDHEQQLKPGDYEGQTDQAALQQDLPRPKIFSQTLAIIEEPWEMITQHRSYHNEISGEEAEKRLKIFGNHHYLTRYSENQKCYILSVCASDEDLQFEKIKHFQLKLSDQGIEIQEKKQFADLEEMLKYYETNRLDTAFPKIGDCLTEDNYRARFRNTRKQQVQQEQKQEQQAQLRQKEQEQQQQKEQQQKHMQQHEQQQVQLQQQQAQLMQQHMQLLQTLVQQQVQQQKVNDNPAPPEQPSRCTIL